VRLHLRWVALVTALGALALPASALAVAQIHQHDDGLRDYDARSGAIAPTDAQRSAVRRLRATVTWNRFGTPATLSRRGKYLTKNVRGKNAALAARSWLERNKALFRLSSTAGLGLVQDSRLPFSRGHAVHFRQVFDGLEAVDGGLITIGLTGPAKGRWKVAYVSSSLTRDAASTAGRGSRLPRDGRPPPLRPERATRSLRFEARRTRPAAGGSSASPARVRSRRCAQSPSRRCARVSCRRSSRSSSRARRRPTA
jgi:hypothetical protein